MKIAQIVASLETRHGGPSKSVTSLSRALAQNENDVELLAAEATPRDAKLERWTTRVFKRDWPPLVGRSAGLAAHIASSDYDVIHNHGLWLRPLHYAHQRARSLKVPLVVSPRGMTSPWAWTHRRWKKALAQRLIHPGALEHVSGWHATSAEEESDIRALGFKQPICVAPNGVAALSETAAAQAAVYWQARCLELKGKRTALFYSRFHCKKRVLELIDVWLKIAPPDWILLLVGIPEEYSVAALEAYVYRSSGSQRIKVFDGGDAPPPYAVASLFLLPSHSENFGMSIAEAMANGVPVLVTDRTPWTPLNEAGFGWCVPWSEWPATLAYALSRPAETLANHGTRARDWVLSEYSWQHTALKLAHFYQMLRH